MNNNHKARKRFGQHFLTDSNVIFMIVNAVNVSRQDHIVEIGPGFGALTEQLMPLVHKMDAVEIDRDVIVHLKKHTLPLGNLTIHSADALKYNFCNLQQSNEKLRIVGNLPYNISTPLLFHLLEQRQCIQDMHFMLQKEVVDRLAAKSNTASYGRLSVVIQYFFDVEQLFDISADAFSPPPKVMSSVVRLIPNNSNQLKLRNEFCFSKTVGQAFSKRRKTLRNNFKPELDENHWQQIGIDSSRRAETLSLTEFVQLSNFIDEHISANQLNQDY